MVPRRESHRRRRRSRTCRTRHRARRRHRIHHRLNSPQHSTTSSSTATTAATTTTITPSASTTTTATVRTTTTTTVPAVPVHNCCSHFCHFFLPLPPQLAPPRPPLPLPQLSQDSHPVMKQTSMRPKHSTTRVASRFRCEGCQQFQALYLDLHGTLCFSQTTFQQRRLTFTHLQDPRRGMNVVSFFLLLSSTPSLPPLHTEHHSASPISTSGGDTEWKTKCLCAEGDDPSMIQHGTRRTRGTAHRARHTRRW